MSGQIGFCRVGVDVWLDVGSVIKLDAITVVTIIRSSKVVLFPFLHLNKD